jgi:PAS domain S-box
VAVFCGILTILAALAGILGIVLQNPTLAGLGPGYKTVSLFAAAAWIVLGSIFCIHMIRPLFLAARTIAAAACAAIALACAIELPFNLLGVHSITDEVAVHAGDLLTGHPTTHVSPLAVVLCIPLAIAIIVLLSATGERGNDERTFSAVGLTGAGIFLAGIIIFLSYLYGSPLLYGLAITPMSYISALAACFMGIGLVAAAGTGAYPLRYFSGASTRALILRTFLPLVLVIVFIQDLFILRIEHVYGISDALLLAASLVIFCLIALAIVGFTSRKLGDRVDRAEGDLYKKNEALNAAYEQLAAADEELRRQYDELAEQDKKLQESEDRNRELATLLEHSSQPFVVGYPDGRLAMYNQAFCDLTGYSSTELEQIDWSAVLTPPEWREREAAELERLARTGEPVRYEKENIRKDATRVPVELFVHLIRDPEGRPVKYYSFITDISDRKKSERILAQSERRFRELVRNSFDIIRILDASGHITYESPSSETILGYPEGDLIGKNPLDLIHPDDLARTRADFSKVLTGTNPGTPSEFRVRRADGSYIYVESVGANLLHVPEVGGIVMTIHPIDANKRAALALAASEEKFRLLADFAYDWEYWISPEGRFVYISPSCERITGYTVDEFTADPGLFGKIVHENDRDRIGSHLASITEKPVHHTEEFRIRKKSGEICWIGHSCHAVYDAGGRWIGRRASNRDITKRREAEEAVKKREEDLHAAYEELTASDEELRENYEELAKNQEALRERGERFRALFDHMIEGLALHELVYDAQGNPAEYRILAANEAYEKQLGISRSAVLGKLSCEAYGVTTPPFLDRYAKVALTGTAEQFETYFEPLKKYFHISVYSPKKGHFATIFEDITERREEERALRLADRKLQLMNIVAWHDIQNKVTGLRGYIELSRDLVADETAKKMLRSEDEILKVIHQQLGHTREYQEIGAKPSQWVDVNAVLKIVIALKGSRSVKVTTSVEGLFVYTDPILEKVFSHLIENTLVHAPTATEIRIRYRETTGGLVIVYEDNGPGIAEENKQELFVRTFATTHFGLFFIHDILELSGIGFAETGEPGKGVRFEMTVPRGMYRIDPQPGPGA